MHILGEGYDAKRPEGGGGVLGRRVVEGIDVGSMFALMRLRGHVALWRPECRPQPLGYVFPSFTLSLPAQA